MPKLKVVTICTAEYNNYMDNFLLTFSNLFPNVEKELYIISDKQRQIDIPNIYQIQTQDDYYKLIQLNKPKYIYGALATRTNMFTDDSYFLYIDVDTIFMNKSLDQWDKIWNYFTNNDLVFTHHPIWWQFNKDNVTQEYMIDFYGDNDERSCAVIENKTVWSIMSMFAGKVNAFTQLYKKYTDLVYTDIENHFIPSYPDEQYINKIINDCLDEMGLTYTVDIFTLIKELNSTFLIDYPNIFLYQKYASDKKYKNKANNLRLGNTVINTKQSEPKQEELKTEETQITILDNE